MTQWLKEGKNSTYILFLITFFTTLFSMGVSLLNEMGRKEINALTGLVQKDGPPAIALIGVVVVFFLLGILIQIFFSSLVLHLIAKFLFRIPVTFQVFYRIFLIFISFLSLSLLWQIFLYNNNFDTFLVATNPLILIGMVLLFILLRAVVNINQVKPLLFTLFCYGNYVFFTTLSLGGI
jgi:hypothetical protein